MAPKTGQLKATDGFRIEGALRERGFRVETRPRSQTGTPRFPTLIYVWDTQDRYIGAFKWVAHHGWHMEMVYPTLRSETDLQVAVSTMTSSPEIRAELEILWENYRTSRTQKAWDEYMEVLAAFYTGGRDG